MATGKFEQARGALASFHPQKSDSLELTQARIDVEEGHYPAALRRLDSVSANGRETAAYQHLRGVALEGAGRWSEAAAAYEKAYVLQPSAPTLSAWADVLVLNQQMREAHELLERERGKFPGEVAFNLLAARIHSRTGDLEAAITELTTAALAQPDSLEIQQRLAEAYQAAGHNEKALPLWRELLSKTKKTEERQRYRHRLAECLAATGQFAEAQRLYHVLTLTQPQDMAARVGLAVTRLASDEPAAALEAALKILQTEPDNRDARVVAALSYRRLNQPAKAVELLTALPAEQTADPFVPELLARWRKE